MVAQMVMPVLVSVFTTVNHLSWDGICSHLSKARMKGALRTEAFAVLQVHVHTPPRWRCKNPGRRWGSSRKSTRGFGHQRNADVHALALPTCATAAPRNQHLTAGLLQHLHTVTTSSLCEL